VASTANVPVTRSIVYVTRLVSSAYFCLGLYAAGSDIFVMKIICVKIICVLIFILFAKISFAL